MQLDLETSTLSQALKSTVNQQHYSKIQDLNQASSSYHFQVTRHKQVNKFTQLWSSKRVESTSKRDFNKRDSRGTRLFATKPHLRNAKLFTQHTLVNLSQRFLTPVETKVLAKGMNFALTPKHY